MIAPYAVWLLLTAAPPRVPAPSRPPPAPEPVAASTTARPDPALPDPARNAVRPKPALRLALPDVSFSGEATPRQVALLETALLAELRKLEGVSVIGMGEIRQMLSFEYQRQMMGCQADGQCLAEIAGALGVDEMVHVSVIVEGKISTFSLRRISMRQARVVGSHGKRLDRAGGEELLGAVGPAVQQAFPDRALRDGATRGVDKSIALRLNPPPLPRWAFYATAGAAVLAGAGGVGAGVMSADAQRQWRRLADQANTQPVAGSQLAALESTARSRARTANVLFVAGGALAVAAGVEAFFTDWHGYGAQLEFGGGSAAVKVAGRF
jgi:hypothetical protein